VRLVIKTDGTIAQRLKYDAFGNVLQNTSPGIIPQGIAFATKFWFCCRAVALKADKMRE